MTAVTAAFSALADLLEYGHLLAETDPAGFITCAADEIKTLRGRVGRLERLLRDFRDNFDCDTGANGAHADHCRSCSAGKALNDEAVNVCEHGDHPAPAGKRFCSEACERCESTDQPDGEGCAGVCLSPR